MIDKSLLNQIELEKLGLIKTERIAKLYAEVFAGEPWNESTRCDECQAFFGPDTKVGDNCPTGICCGVLSEAYPLEDTVSYIRREVARPNGRLAVLEGNGIVAGFAWGFEYQMNDFLTQKNRTESNRQSLREALTAKGIGESFYYFSECGVSPLFRGRGLSNILSGEIVKQAEQFSLPLVMRTNCQSPMVAVARKFGMEQVFGPLSVASEGRIITTDACIAGIDIDNPERVMFIKK
jgi:hypothetical protein